ncbi:hypothetical protein SLS56_010496 [Neofusicoccum ribis]|uniref:LysM domain-containing protein n=1 Tax=Neofusicoccum ribis TaxID=45134 RepID=A0ABR3SE86_9PEZI
MFGADQMKVCNGTVSLNTTVGSYIVQENETMPEIAAKVGRGVCDIARANRMADALMLYTDEELIIPAQVCDPDNDTCLVPNTTTTNTCINGGPHTYTTFLGDTVAYIAQKFNVTLDTLTAVTNNTISDSYAEIEAGNQIKIPMCSPSQCIMQPYRFSYGTYADLAKNYSTTVGQIMAYNAGYNKSTATTVDESPAIAVPMNCTALSDTLTVIT